MAVVRVATFTASSSSITGVTCAQGNYLSIQVLLVASGNNPVTVASASDNAAGSANVYNIPAGANGGAFFASQNQFASIATIWCEVKTALSGNTITLVLNGTATVATIVTGETFSGLPAGCVTLTELLTSFLSTVSSAASPSGGARAGSLAIANVNVNGAASSVSNSYALNPSSFSAWRGPVADGNTSTTFTLTASSPVWSTTLVVIGQPGTPQPLVVPQAAVMQAANW